MLQTWHFTGFFRKFKSNLLVKRFFFVLNVAFAIAILGLISQVHLPSSVNMLPKYLKHFTFSSCFWSIVIITGDGCLENGVTIGNKYEPFEGSKCSHFQSYEECFCPSVRFFRCFVSSWRRQLVSKRPQPNARLQIAIRLRTSVQSDRMFDDACAVPLYAV